MSNTKRSSSGCFSSVLRRILCSRTPQTYPSDSDHIVNDVAKVQVQVQASETGPGIVARLMGLDSLPENNNWLHKSKIPGPVTRSRSVNFMDYMLEFDLKQAKHRRIKTSSSFREQPQGPQLFQVQHNQNQEFLVVYLDKNNDAAGFEASQSGKRDGSSSEHGKKKDINVREKVDCNKKQIREKNKKISKLKNEPRGRRVSGKHSFETGSCINGANSKALKEVNQKEVSVVTRKKKNQSRQVKKIQLSENPFPVLHVNDISEDSRSLEMKLKKKCSSKSVKHNDSTTKDIISARISMPEGLEKQDFTKNNLESTKKVFTFEAFEEICAEFGDQIFDFMLQQEADELCRISHANY